MRIPALYRHRSRARLNGSQASITAMISSRDRVSGTGRRYWNFWIFMGSSTHRPRSHANFHMADRHKSSRLMALWMGRPASDRRFSLYTLSRTELVKKSK